jgi:putative ABC transport system permease protein
VFAAIPRSFRPALQTAFAVVVAPWQSQKGRLLVSLVAIAAGVALGYAVQLVNRAAVNELTQAIRFLAGEADLVVRGPRGGMDESLFPRVARMPGVAVASAMLEREVRPAGQTDRLRVMAVDVFRAARIQPLLFPETEDTMDVLRDDTVLLSRVAAEWLGLHVGDSLVLEAGRRDVRLRVAGIADAGDLRQRIALIDIAAAQRHFDALGLITRLDVRLQSGVDAARFRDALQRELPPGVHAELPDATIRGAADPSRAYRVNLNVLALFALFTGGLLVFSTQALAVTRRRSQLALARVLGLTRRRLVCLIVAEGAAIGAAGALAGLAAGYLLAKALLGFVGADLGAGHFHGLEAALAPEPLAMAVYFTLGVAAAVLGSLVPALEAGRMQPAHALKPGDEQRVFERLRPAWPGLLLIATGIALSRLGPVADLPLPGYAAIAMLLLGTLVLLPRFAAFALDRLPVPASASLQLALAQLRGAPGQATVSLAAVVAAVSLMVSMAIMVTSFRASLETWLDRVLPAELYLRTGVSGDTRGLSPHEQSRIAALPGVRRIEFLRSRQLLLDPQRPHVSLIARELDPQQPHRDLPLVSEPIRPADGQPPPVWVSEIAAAIYGFEPGAEIEVPIAGRNVRFTVAGIWRDYARQNGALLIERSLYVALTGDDDASDAGLWLQPGTDPRTIAAAVRDALPGAQRIEIAETAEIRRLSLGMFDRTFAVTYALEGVALLIALFGLSASIGGLVLARRREFGVLRHLGMTRKQIGAMLAAEGALLGGIGLAAGITLGWIVSLILIHVVNPQSFHWSMEMHMPWLELFLFVAAVFALSTLTALVSGRQAMSDEAVRAVREDW